MDKSPFAKIPPELRNTIWQLALTRERPIWLHSSRTEDINTPLRAHHGLALTETCSEIRRKTLKLFFAINTFAMANNRYAWTGTTLHALRACIDDANLAPSRHAFREAHDGTQAVKSLTMAPRPELAHIEDVRLDLRNLTASWEATMARLRAGERSYKGLGSNLAFARERLERGEWDRTVKRLEVGISED